MSRKARAIIFVCGCLLLVPFTPVGYALHRVYNRAMYEGTFNQSAWLAYQHSETAANPRGNMAEYVRDHVIQHGMTRQAVLEQLGPPDVEQAACQDIYTEAASLEGLNANKTACMISYNIGKRDWLDYGSLDLYFDVGGRVLEIRIAK
jgi:hypothetical protein